MLQRIRSGAVIILVLASAGCEKDERQSSVAEKTERLKQELVAARTYFDRAAVSAKAAVLYERKDDPGGGMRASMEIGGFLFTADWFTNNVSRWNMYMARFHGKPGIRCLEIGSFEGLSSIYIAEKYCNGPGSSLDCVDTFDGSDEHYLNQKHRLLDRFLHNTAPFIKNNVIRYHRSLSWDALVRFNREALTGKRQIYDFIYIDASHWAKDVLTDAVMSWELLKVGGIMAFDDYRWNWDGGEIDSVRNPKPGIDAFLKAYESMYTIIHRDYQLHIMKTRERPVK